MKDLSRSIEAYSKQCCAQLIPGSVKWSQAKLEGSTSWRGSVLMISMRVRATPGDM
jgi:hypothetical protein